MSEKGVHYLAMASIKERLAKTNQEIEELSIQLQEALKMGDLRENSEYDAAKEAMSKATRERDMLAPVMSMPIIRSMDNVKIFEEGSVVDLKVYGATTVPVEVNSEEFQRLSKGEPIFSGTVMLGGTLPIQELMEDAALDVETPVGSFLLGKPSGDYCIKVPGGFAIVSAKKLDTSSITPEMLGCVYNEQ